jgi:hypothetical protein
MGRKDDRATVALRRYRLSTRHRGVHGGRTECPRCGRSSCCSPRAVRSSRWSPSVAPASSFTRHARRHSGGNEDASAHDREARRLCLDAHDARFDRGSGAQVPLIVSMARSDPGRKRAGTQMRTGSFLPDSLRCCDGEVTATHHCAPRDAAHALHQENCAGEDQQVTDAHDVTQRQEHRASEPVAQPCQMRVSQDGGVSQATVVLVEVDRGVGRC